MTLEQLLNADADSLDKLSPQELTDYFKQFFPTTRPELARKTIQQTNGSTRASRSQMELPKLSNNQREHLSKLASMGIDISFASHPVRKKR